MSNWSDVSDVPTMYYGYTGEPKNWLDELRELSIFLAVTEGDDDRGPLPEDGVYADA